MDGWMFVVLVLVYVCCVVLCCVVLCCVVLCMRLSLVGSLVRSLSLPTSDDSPVGVINQDKAKCVRATMRR